MNEEFWYEYAPLEPRLRCGHGSESPFRIAIEREDPETIIKFDNNFDLFWKSTQNKDRELRGRGERLFTLIWRSQSHLAKLFIGQSSEHFARDGFNFLCALILEPRFGIRKMKMDMKPIKKSRKADNVNDDYELIIRLLSAPGGLKRSSGAAVAISFAYLRHKRPDLWTNVEILSRERKNYKTYLKQLLSNDEDAKRIEKFKKLNSGVELRSKLFPKRQKLNLVEEAEFQQYKQVSGFKSFPS